MNTCNIHVCSVAEAPQGHSNEFPHMLLWRIEENYPSVVMNAHLISIPDKVGI